MRRGDAGLGQYGRACFISFVLQMPPLCKKRMLEGYGKKRGKNWFILELGRKENDRILVNFLLVEQSAYKSFPP